MKTTKHPRCDLWVCRTIAGVAFKAVQYAEPRPHWRAKVVNTGYVFSAGVFNSQSKPKLWQSIYETALRRGNSFTKETLEAT